MTNRALVLSGLQRKWYTKRLLIWIYFEMLPNDAPKVAVQKKNFRSSAVTFHWGRGSCFMERTHIFYLTLSCPDTALATVKVSYSNFRRGNKGLFIMFNVFADWIFGGRGLYFMLLQNKNSLPPNRLHLLILSAGGSTESSPDCAWINNMLRKNMVAPTSKDISFIGKIDQSLKRFFCVFVWIISTSLFSTCRLYRDRQKPANRTQCPTLMTDS